MWDEQFEELVSSFLPFQPAGRALSADTNLRDLGLDSMGVVELMTALESHYDVRFMDEALSLETFATPAVLWGELSKLLAPAI
ncbi:acyl carrier protein [Micromonospora sp. NBC_01699]|uniref:acyl carrier protein n=1 Tax=Micromonospora sp. NBC_01699 TaxID=2975984 RepID=UPI002E28DE70|nr:acyl carrier protein [Micromonospora sp. NBC_01699]